MDKQQTAFDLLKPRGKSAPAPARQPRQTIADMRRDPRARTIMQRPSYKELFAEKLLPAMYPGRLYTAEALSWRTQITAGKIAIILRRMARDGLCNVSTSSTFKTVFWITDKDKVREHL